MFKMKKINFKKCKNDMGKKVCQIDIIKNKSHKKYFILFIVFTSIITILSIFSTVTKKNIEVNRALDPKIKTVVKASHISKEAKIKKLLEEVQKLEEKKQKKIERQEREFIRKIQEEKLDEIELKDEA